MFLHSCCEPPPATLCPAARGTYHPIGSNRDGNAQAAHREPDHGEPGTPTGVVSSPPITRTTVSLPLVGARLIASSCHGPWSIHGVLWRAIPAMPGVEVLSSSHAGGSVPRRTTPGEFGRRAGGRAATQGEKVRKTVLIHWCSRRVARPLRVRQQHQGHDQSIDRLARRPVRPAASFHGQCLG